MKLKEDVKKKLRATNIPAQIIDSFLYLVDHQFLDIKSYDELTSEEKPLISRYEFEYLFGE